MNIDVHGFVRVGCQIGDTFRHHLSTQSIVHLGVGGIVSANFTCAKK